MVFCLVPQLKEEGGQERYVFALKYFHIDLYLLYVILMQMRIKVDRVTNVLLEEAAGSPEMMSQLVANVNSQRACVLHAVACVVCVVLGWL